MTSECGYSTKKFHLQKVDGGQTGRQDLSKTKDFRKIAYIAFKGDLKGKAFRGIQVKKKLCIFETPYEPITLKIFCWF